MQKVILLIDPQSQSHFWTSLITIKLPKNTYVGQYFLRPENGIIVYDFLYFVFFGTLENPLVVRAMRCFQVGTEAGTKNIYFQTCTMGDPISTQCRTYEVN